ncbi:MAG TPA: hypothetical protein VKV17_10555 [Bryobacteraceae bacterium]|nr:hypothetical protein [Bryobacteraceae bacterium]
MYEVLGMKGGQAAAAAMAPAAARKRLEWKFERGPKWDETLQSASRLRLAMGEEQRVAAVTGIEANDGPARLAARLAFALAEIEKSPILLVDGSSTAPTLETIFGLSATSTLNPAAGLVDVLEGRSTLAAALLEATPENLAFLPLGTSSQTPASLLATDAWSALLREARERFRYVVIAAGLPRKSAAAMLLSSLADGVVLALARGVRRRDEVAAFQQELENLKIPTLGAVLTRAAAKR